MCEFSLFSFADHKEVIYRFNHTRMSASNSSQSGDIFGSPRQRANSCGEFDYLSKRKRSDDNHAHSPDSELEAFRSSKKVFRSPPQKVFQDSKMNDSTNEIKAALDSILKELNVIKKQNESLKSDTNTLKLESSQLKSELQKIKSEQEEQRQSVGEVKLLLEEKQKVWLEEKNQLLSRLKRLEDAAEKKDRLERKNNIVISGLKSDGDYTQTVMNFMREKLDLVLSPVSVTPLVKKNENQPTMLLVKLHSYEEKNRIMNKRNVLKGSQVYLNNDMTVLERQKQKKIREMARLERQNSGRKVFVGHLGARIDGVWHEWDFDQNKFVPKNAQ